MKRMSEVFELPVDHNKLEVYGCNHAETYSEAETHAAHAINHIDALADALDALIKQTVKVYSNSKALGEAENAAVAALEAYRGEK